MKPEDSDLYFEREQTQIKHLVLEKYLERFARIVGQWADGIIYIDGFSGPWNTVSKEFRDSSFAIALKQLRAARDTVRQVAQKDLRLQCIFLEKDPAAFAQLRAFADEQNDVEIFALNLAFEDAVPELVRFVESRKHDHFPFILIGPKGWKGFAMEVIAPLLKIRPCEVLVNFMTGHIQRFIDDERDGVKASFRRLFGDASFETRIESLRGQAREDAIVATYAERLSAVGGYLRLLLKQAGEDPQKVQIDATVIAPDRIRSVEHSKLAGLQVADAVASGLHFAVRVNRYGETEPAYLPHLKKGLYRHKGAVFGYGLKVWPEDLAAIKSKAPEAANLEGL